MNEALLEARRLEHAYTLTYVMTFACRAEWAAGSRNETRQQAEEMVNLSNQHGFLQFLGWGLLHRGSSLTARGQEQEGLTLLTKGLSALRSTGGVASTPYALVMIAEAYAKLGQPVEALNCLAEAAQIIETTDDRFSEANVHWLRGNLMIATGDIVAAEQSYHQALTIAKRQSAKLFELRAATNLARLWRDQDKRTEARDLLAPVYRWFTEGFDMPVLKEAKALLDQLA